MSKCITYEFRVNGKALAAHCVSPSDKVEIIALSEVPVIKPKKKLIDWSKMPRGAMTNCGELIGFSSPHPVSGKIYPQCLRKSFDSSSYNMEQLRLEEQTQFTYWGGGECPVPEGVNVKCILRKGIELNNCSNLYWMHDYGVTPDRHIIAYRITGLADGWTDNPEESV